MILLFLFACAPDIRDTDGDGKLDVADSPPESTPTDSRPQDSDPPDPGDDSAPPADHTVVSVPEGATGVTYVDVDASSETAAVYFDFSSPTSVGASAGWELSFTRSVVLTNGGSSGSGGVEVARIEDVSLEEVTEAPGSGYVSDTADTPALGDWYDYDPANHTLSAHPRVYVLKNGAGEHYKLQFVDYYDDAGNSGHPSFRWALLGGG